MSFTQTFVFESDFVASLRCVPMAVRFKLDVCGVKVSLRQWSRFTRADRQALLVSPCASDAEISAYRAALRRLIALRAGETAKPLGETPSFDLWRRTGPVPPVVAAFALGRGAVPPTEGEWAALTELQRFVLVKLTRDNHDNVNFIPAMEEFGLGAPGGAPTPAAR